MFPVHLVRLVIASTSAALANNEPWPAGIYVYNMSDTFMTGNVGSHWGLAIYGVNIRVTAGMEK